MVSNMFQPMIWEKLPGNHRKPRQGVPAQANFEEVLPASGLEIVWRFGLGGFSMECEWDLMSHV
jgi:hypothetical protein